MTGTIVENGVRRGLVLPGQALQYGTPGEPRAVQLDMPTLRVRSRVGEGTRVYAVPQYRFAVGDRPAAFRMPVRVELRDAQQRVLASWGNRLSIQGPEVSVFELASPLPAGVYGFCLIALRGAFDGGQERCFPLPVDAALGGAEDGSAPKGKQATPSVRLSAARLRLRGSMPPKRLRVRCRMSAAGTCKVVVRVNAAAARRMRVSVPRGAKSVVIAGGSARIPAKRTRTMSLPVTRSGRSVLRRLRAGKSLRLAARATARLSGTTYRSSVTLVVRR